MHLLMSRKFAEQCSRERAGETWDNALLYAFRMEVDYAPEFSPRDGLLILHVCEVRRSTPANVCVSARALC